MKRTLAFLLVLTLVLGVLTGCGGSTSESTKAPETTAAAIATVGAAEATEADPSADKYGGTFTAPAFRTSRTSAIPPRQPIC